MIGFGSAAKAWTSMCQALILFGQGRAQVRVTHRGIGSAASYSPKLCPVPLMISKLGMLLE